MKTQHTPGPWHRNISPATKYCVIFSGRNEHIASIRHAKEGEEAEANHNLITAAPDLLAALEAVTLAIEQLVDIDPGSPAALSVAKARAAIAKARGEL